MEMDRNTLQHTDAGLPTGNMFEQVRSKIMTVRETVVILDADIADLYGVETKRVNEAVKNNPDKFPSTYMFRLTREEMIFLRSKNPTAKISSKSRVLPAVFTERGLYMLATILKSKKAVNATFAIIETFANVRQLKRELRTLHQETDSHVQQSKMKHFGEMLSDIVMPDLETAETESTLELNFLIGKIKHTVKRVKKQNGSEHTETE